MTTNIRLFGTCRVGTTSGPINLPGGKPRELLAYLVLHPRRLHAREALTDVLFPDVDPHRARRNLTDALHRLRQSLGPHDADWLISTAEHIGLNTRSLWVDVWAFETAHDETAALALYEGDLAEDLDAVWLLGSRARLRELCLLRFEHACARLTVADEFTTALTLANRWASIDPLSEEAHCAAMRLYARLGRHAAALGHFDSLRRALSAELGAQPSPTTQTLAELIRIEFEARTRDRNHAPAFVGREAERRGIATLAERTQSGSGSLILIEGEPGMGKTRLLETLGETLSWRGFDVAWGRGQPTVMPPAHSPLTGAVLDAIAGPRAQHIRNQLTARLSPAALEALALMMPRFLPNDSRSSMTQFSAPPRRPIAAAVMNTALADCIVLLTEMRPQALLLDDVQWAGSAFWDALQAVAPTIAQQRLLLVMAARGEELRRDERAWCAARRLDEHTNVVHLQLGGLSEVECAHLARSMGEAVSQSSLFDAGDIEVLHRHTQGNPLFVIESLRHPGHAIATFQSSLERRLAMLSADTQRALQAAAVLGHEFRHGAWQAMADVDVLAVVDELLTSRFIQETERGYSFQHELTHRHIIDAIAPALAQRLHGRAGDVLSREQVNSDIVADHFERAERWPEALRFWRAAGDEAVHDQAFANALGHYERALKLVEHLAPATVAQAERLALLCRRQRVLGTLVRTGDWLADLQEIERLATILGDSEALLTALEARITLNVYSTDLAEMRATAQHALALARSLGDAQAETRISVTLSTHLVNVLGRPDEALPLLHKAQALAHSKGDDALSILAQCNVSVAQRFSGDCAGAYESAQRALALIDARPALAWARPNVLQSLGSAAWFVVDFPRAIASLAQAFQLHLESGNAFAAGDAGLNLALVYASCGQAASAQNVVEQLFALMSRLHLPSNSDMILWLHALATECAMLTGDLAGARRAMHRLTLSAEFTRAQPSRAQLLAWQAMGRLHLAEGKPATAAMVLAQAVHAFEQGTTIKAEPVLLHAMAAIRAGQGDAAIASLHLAEQRLHGHDYALLKPLLHFARFDVLGDLNELRQSRQIIQQQALCFTDPAQRRAFVERVPLHCEIEQHWQAHARPSQVTVRLARANAPLGRTLADNEHVTVTWTVDAGEEDTLLLESQGMQALRRARLERLIAEAQGQGASPTHIDLAAALGVNVRTVARDLAATGIVGTRRTKLDMRVST